MKLTKRDRLIKIFNIMEDIEDVLDMAYHHKYKRNRITHKKLIIIQRRLSLVKNHLVK